MWIMLPDAFLSIVQDRDAKRGELLVRARVKGHIELIFPGAKVTRTATNADYLYRATVAKEDVEKAVVGEVGRITYDNFKKTVADHDLHDAYLRCWSAMKDLQDRLDRRPQQQFIFAAKVKKKKGGK